MATPAESHRHAMGVEVTGEALEVHRLHGATVVALGERELTRQIDIAPFMQRIADTSAASEDAVIVLDCRHVEAVGSILIGELISLNRKLDADGKQLRLASLKPEAKKVLQITGLKDMLPVYPDIKSAVAAKGKKRWWWPFGR